MNKLSQIFKIKEIRNKIFIVAGLLLAFRLLAAIPIPGVDPAKLAQYFGSNQLLGFLNFFPKFKEMYYEEGSRGQAKFNQYARLLTVPLALLQAYGFLSLLISQGVVNRPDFFSLIRNVLVITAGSMLTLWIGELISEQKMGNGISLVILAGIVSSLPSTIGTALFSYTPQLLPTYAGFVIITMLVIAGVVFLNEGERKVPIAYARRVRGTKLYGGSSSYL